YWLSWLIFVPLGAFLAWLQSLASPNSSAPPPAEILPPPALPRAPVTPSNPGGWTAWSESLVFWLLFLGVFAVSFLFLVRQRPEVEQLLRRLALPWPWLAERWRAVWAAGRRLRQEVARLAQAGLDRLRPSGPPPSAPWRYLNVRRLQPRERVRFYYQALLRRGRETGWPRRPGETPLEYEQNLAEALPEAQTPLADLTGEFLEAQFSAHAIPPAAAESARERWEAVRRALRARRTPEAGAPESAPEQKP
ncbi:MAG: DUF4129 domain-containing protein, partial [Anaerolineales bacterium]|nr:DUF4129 domain-containing protein [Anaerolineales bacterium]